MFGRLGMLKDYAKMMKETWTEYAINEIAIRTAEKLQNMGYEASIKSIEKDTIKIDTNAPDELKQQIFNEVKKEVVKELKKKRKEMREKK